MNSILPAAAGARHLDRLERVPAVMAKADLKLKNREPWRTSVGAAVRRCFALAGLSQKEAAALLQLDPAQVQRWIAGSERPQVDTIFSVEQLRQPFVVALAEMAGAGIEVTTAITIRRVA